MLDGVGVGDDPCGQLRRGLGPMAGNFGSNSFDRSKQQEQDLRRVVGDGSRDGAGGVVGLVMVLI